MALSAAVIRAIATGGLHLETRNQAILVANLKEARNKLLTNPEAFQYGKFGQLLEEVLTEFTEQSLNQWLGLESFEEGIAEGQMMAGDSLGIPKGSPFWSWTPLIPVNAISVANSQFASAITNATADFQEKALRTVQQGLAMGASTAGIMDQLLGVGLRGSQGRDGVFRSATVRAETIARTVTNDVINQGALLTYREMDKIVPELALEKLWQTLSDHRTSARCISLSGQRVGLSDNFRAADGWSGPHPPSHPNCRSRITTVGATYKPEWDKRWPKASRPKTKATPKANLSSPLPRLPSQLTPLKPESVISTSPQINAAILDELFTEIDTAGARDRVERVKRLINKQEYRGIFLQDRTDEAYQKQHFEAMRQTPDWPSYMDPPRTWKLHFPADPSLGHTYLVNPATLKGYNVKPEFYNFVAVKMPVGGQPLQVSNKGFSLASAISAAKRHETNPEVTPYWAVFAALDKRDAAKRTLATYVHEVGHRVSFDAGRKLGFESIPPVPPGVRTLTRYAATNDDEWYAEHFAAWVFDAEAYRKFDPVGAKHIQSLLEILE